MDTALRIGLILYFAVGLNVAYLQLKGMKGMFERMATLPGRGAARIASDLLTLLLTTPPWKRRLFLALDFVVESAVWPLVLLERRAIRSRGIDQLPSGPDLVMRQIPRRSLFVLGAMIVLALAKPAMGSSGTGYVVLATWFLLCANVARQLQELMSEKFLVTMARRSWLTPSRATAALAVTAAGDLATLTLASVLLLKWRGDNPFQITWLYEQLLAVLRARHTGNLLHMISASPSQVLIGVASVVFYASLIAPLVTWRVVRPTGDDLLAASESALRAGKASKAVSLLTKAETRSPSDRPLGRVRGLIALANHDLPAAFEEARALIRLNTPRVDVPKRNQIEDGACVIAFWSREFPVWAPPPPTLLTFVLEQGVSDSFIMYFTTEFSDVVFGAGLTHGEHSARLKAHLKPPDWPLTFAFATEFDGDSEASRVRLSGLTLEPGFDRIVRNQMLRLALLKTSKEPSKEDKCMIEAAAEDILVDISQSRPAEWAIWQKNAMGRALSLIQFIGDSAGIDEDLLQRLRERQQTLTDQNVLFYDLAVSRNIIDYPLRRD